jgi:hypothetical protein
MRLSVLVSVLLSIAIAQSQDYTRGVGVYPGDPRAYVGPEMRLDNTNYRNLAFHRPAWHSSSYDYNLTAQLVTDGIRDPKLPRWVAVSTSQHGLLKKNEREWLLDGNWVTGVDLRGSSVWVQIELGGGETPPEVDRVDVEGSVQGPQPDNQNWSCTVLGSEDARAWRRIGIVSGMARPSGELRATIDLVGAVRHRMYRLQLDTGRQARWNVGEVRLYRRSMPLRIAGPWNFSSSWMAESAGEQWVSVDLGADCSFDRAVLAWVRRPKAGMIQISPDAKSWTPWQTIQESGTLIDDLKTEQPARARYVRVLATHDNPEGPVILSELEIYGRGGPVPEPKPVASPETDSRITLSGGSWKVQRDSLVTAGGEIVSRPGFADRDWVVATVPGTVLASYFNAGAIPDPNFGDNQLMISDSFFHADFWYRNEFVTPRLMPEQHLWLNFDGINWKADVFLNGRNIGRIEGAFLRGQFDITQLVRTGQKNALAVRVEKVATPGSIKEKTYQTPDKNGGALGADNPTFHATIGWDWIPTIRGRDTGIWNSVSLVKTGAVTLENPSVNAVLPLPDTSRADISLGVTLRNHGTSEISGTLRGRFGEVAFDLPVRMAASSEQTITLDPSSHPELRLQNPRLWWPAGYGEPERYHLELKFEMPGGRVSDAKELDAGIRQFTYSEEGGALRLWINGRRFIPRGGNWGFSESLLRYRAREYDAAVRYHRDMNFTMIRNWVGQIGEDEFYDACDRYGIVVWQDFWLANPWDGPDPANDAMFLRNVKDTILRIRHHPSVGLYCGRNEGYPPKPIDDAIRATLAALHPGTHYISSSADDVVSGHGPYQAMPLKSYFDQRAPPKFHSEMGMPNIVSLDSLQLMMPETAMWPQGPIWGLHDFCLGGAQGGRSFNERIQQSYGAAENAGSWVRLAQFVNYEGYRAMFEAQSRNRMGLLIWMSHPAWPSFLWQTYDYYLEPTAAYYGARKGSEPLHIQWNPSTDAVEVVNYSGGGQDRLSAAAELLNHDGKVVWQKSAELNSAEDSTEIAFTMEYPASLSTLHFIRLRLTQDNRLISDNFYWRGLEEGNYRALRDLPQAKLESNTRAERSGDRWVLTTEIFNDSKTPALMVRLKAVRAKSGDRILPVLYSDNYISLMPGERRTITTEVRDADTRGEPPSILVERESI